jgi:hypothetical protein
MKVIYFKLRITVDDTIIVNALFQRMKTTCIEMY